MNSPVLNSSARLLAPVLVFVMTIGSAMAGPPAKSGQFEGRSRHVTTGDVSIERVNGQTLLLLAENFSLDGAPDPKIGFGKNGFDHATMFSKLRRNDGAQKYVVPASIDVSRYNEVYIWCEKYNVPLGVAKVK